MILDDSSSGKKYRINGTRPIATLQEGPSNERTYAPPICFMNVGRRVGRLQVAMVGIEGERNDDVLAGETRPDKPNDASIAAAVIIDRLNSGHMFSRALALLPCKKSSTRSFGAGTSNNTRPAFMIRSSVKRNGSDDWEFMDFRRFVTSALAFNVVHFAVAVLTRRSTDVSLVPSPLVRPKMLSTLSRSPLSSMSKCTDSVVLRATANFFRTLRVAASAAWPATLIALLSDWASVPSPRASATLNHVPLSFFASSAKNLKL